MDAKTERYKRIRGAILKLLAQEHRSAKLTQTYKNLIESDQ
jgi:hypothetical protein